MSAAVEMVPVDAEAERAKVEASRAETLAAQDKLIEVSTAGFDELVVELRATALGERPGANIDQHFRKLSEETAKLHNLVQHRLNLPHRWEREDATTTKPAVSLRKTGPVGSIRWNMVATPLINAIGVDSPFGPDDERLLDHALLVVLLIGEDMPVQERAAEAFHRLTRFVGSYADSDLALDAVERKGGVVQRLGLMGRRLPPIPFPDDEPGQRLHTRLQMLELRALSGFAVSPVATRDEQALARHYAWRFLIDEEAREQANKGKSRGQIEIDLLKGHPAWARDIGLQVPD